MTSSSVVVGGNCRMLSASCATRDVSSTQSSGVIPLWFDCLTTGVVSGTVNAGGVITVADVIEGAGALRLAEVTAA